MSGVSFTTTVKSGVKQETIYIIGLCGVCLESDTNSKTLYYVDRNYKCIEAVDDKYIDQILRIVKYSIYHCDLDEDYDITQRILNMLLP